MSPGSSSTGLTTDAHSTMAPTRSLSLAAKLSDYIALSKPRIVVLELVAVLLAMHMATNYGAPGSPWSTVLLLGVTVGTALVAGSANGLNQWLERERDAIMTRTRTRPLPAGRLTPDEALLFSVLTLAMGTTTLVMFAGWMPAVVAVVTWVIYVAIYTPMKSRTWLNTAVGAVSGATPLAIGWTAGGGDLLAPLSLSLLGVMYLWQFPHFMAIAWICREDYAKVNYQMSTTLDPTGWWAGVQAVVGSALLLPVSLWPFFVGDRIPSLGAPLVVFLAGLVLLMGSARFFANPSHKSAMKLMRYSLLYVPVWLFALWFASV